MAYGYTYKNFNSININKQQITQKQKMFDTLYNEEDSLPMEWNFISQVPEKNSRNSNEGENRMPIMVEMNQDQKMIQFSKSTLVMDYSLRELCSMIIKTFQLVDKTVEIKVYVNHRLISNDHLLRQLIQSMRASAQQPILVVQARALEKKMPCILCMKEECEHNMSPAFSSNRKDKKRKSAAAMVTKKSSINILEPEKIEIDNKKKPQSIVKKRKFNCRAYDLSLSQDLSLPLVESYTF